MKRSIITLYLILSEITQTTMDVVTALKMTFTSFKERGISKIQENNASLITNQLEAFELSLNEVDSLLEEAQLYILKIFSIFSCDNLRKTFQFQETDERIKNIPKKHVGGSTNLYRVKVILWRENELYN